MAHYAFLDEDNIVTQVIVGRNEDEIVDGISDWESYYADIYGQKCVRTSYNGNIRKHYAGIGFFYDQSSDVFIPPQPFPSWSLDSDFNWQPPTQRPTPEENYWWNEETLTWEEIEQVPAE